MEDSKCPKCWAPIHPGHYETHVAKCHDWLEYGVTILLTSDLARRLTKSNSVENWNSTYGKIVLEFALNFCDIPVSDRHKVLSEIDRSVIRDQYIVRLRSRHSLPGLHKMEEGAPYYEIYLDRKVLEGWLFRIENPGR